jgi:pyruvate dehydrogenase E1 component beta subunit
VCFLEGEMLYNTKGEVPEEEYVIPLGKAELKREGEHATIVTHGQDGARGDAGRRPAREGGAARRRGRPAHRAPHGHRGVYASVRKTNRCVVVEEGWEQCGVGAQVVDYVQRECFDHLDAPVLRVHQADVPMPYAKQIEKLAKPTCRRRSRR